MLLSDSSLWDPGESCVLISVQGQWSGTWFFNAKENYSDLHNTNILDKVTGARTETSEKV